CRNTRLFWHMQIAQCRAHAPFIGTQLINKLLPWIFRMNIQANAQQQTQAEEMLSAIMQELGYVGVMAMECFVTPQGLLINELAPRVHNSGHWTQNGASISQFE
ncbi:phosphoribosylaminoimidazole carboxylase ATPase subunit, nonfunctional, partial [human gut metagenome]